MEHPKDYPHRPTSDHMMPPSHRFYDAVIAVVSFVAGIGVGASLYWILESFK